MKRTIFSFCVLFFLLNILIYPQIKNLKSMEGTWIGQWVNSYYQSTGSINAIFTVNEVTMNAHGEWTVGGNILGTPRAPFSTDITLTSTGFTANFNSAIWGDISGTGLNTGAYSGSAVNCPNPNAQNIAAAGTFNNTTINGTFTFNWYGNPISGTVQMTKQNVVADPTNLTAIENPYRTINLQWNDNSNNETGFRIDTKKSTGPWTEIATVSANIKTYQEQNVDVETQYTYRVAAFNASTESEYSNEATLKTMTSVEDKKIIPSDYLLMQNYPNPFNPNTLIRYNLPRESRVIISVFTILGEKILTLVNEIQNEGNYELPFDAAKYSSGIYLVKMTAQSMQSGQKFVDVKKMLLMK